MKKQRGSIMVAVQALDRSSRGLLRKAAVLARTRGCDLELVHVIALPYAPAVSRRANLRQAAQEIVEDSKQKLLKLASSSELKGIPTDATVTWDYPAVSEQYGLGPDSQVSLSALAEQIHPQVGRPCDRGGRSDACARQAISTG
jgi:hypothetical protein